MPRPQNKLRTVFSPTQEESKIQETTKPINGHLAALLQAERKQELKNKK